MSLLGDLRGQVDDTISALPGGQTLAGASGDDLTNRLPGRDIAGHATHGQDKLANLLLGKATDDGEAPPDHAGRIMLVSKIRRDATLFSLDVDGDVVAQSVFHISGNETAMDHSIS